MPCARTSSSSPPRVPSSLACYLLVNGCQVHSAAAQSAKRKKPVQLAARRTADSGAPSNSRLGTSGFRLRSGLLGAGVGCWVLGLGIGIGHWAPGSRLPAPGSGFRFRLPASGLGLGGPTWAWAWVTPGSRGFCASGLRLGIWDAGGWGCSATHWGAMRALVGVLCDLLSSGAMHALVSRSSR
jgi:hypothetical protein